jgi:hypothetical protein
VRYGTVDFKDPKRLVTRVWRKIVPAKEAEELRRLHCENLRP